MAAQSLGVDPGRFDLGRLDRGATWTGSANVRNTGPGALDVAVLFEGAAASMLSASPASFALSPGDGRPVVLTLAVASGAAPGLHDSAVVVRALATGEGGTAAPSARLPLTFVVRALDVAAAGVADATSFYARVASGHDAARSATVNATLLVGGTIAWSRDSAPVALGPDGSAVVTFAPSRPADGVHDLRLQAFEGAVGLGLRSYRAEWSGGALVAVTSATAATGGGGGGGGGAQPAAEAGPAPATKPAASASLVAPIAATDDPVRVTVGDPLLEAVRVDLAAAHAGAELHLEFLDLPTSRERPGFESLRAVRVEVVAQGQALAASAYDGAAFVFEFPRGEAEEREAQGQAPAALDVASGQRYVATGREVVGPNVAYTIAVPHFSDWLLGFVLPPPLAALEGAWEWNGPNGLLRLAPLPGATWLVVELDGAVVYRGPYVETPFRAHRAALAPGEHTVRAIASVGGAEAVVAVPMTVTVPTTAAVDPPFAVILVSLVVVGAAAVGFVWLRLRLRPTRIPRGRLGTGPIPVRQGPAAGTGAASGAAESAARDPNAGSVATSLKPRSGPPGSR